MVMLVHKFIVPLFLTTGVRKRKNYWLTMNNYRNWHFQVNNNLKKLFKDVISLERLDSPLQTAINIEYILFYPDKRKRDIGNSLAVLDKFFEDALVEANWLVDDNYEYVKTIIVRYGGISPTNPRCEIIITNHVKQTEIGDLFNDKQ